MQNLAFWKGKHFIILFKLYERKSISFICGNTKLQSQPEVNFWLARPLLCTEPQRDKLQPLKCCQRTSSPWAQHIGEGVWLCEGQKNTDGILQPQGVRLV